MDGFDLQASFKTKNDTLINVRGDSPEDFDQNLSHAVSVVEKIHAAEAAFKGLAPQTMEDGVALLQTTLGAQVIGEYETPPASYDQGPPPGWAAPPQAPPAYQQTHCDRCKTSPTCKTCNRPATVAPRSVKNGQYWIHDCPSGDRDHKGSWCNLPK